MILISNVSNYFSIALENITLLLSQQHNAASIFIFNDFGYNRIRRPPCHEVMGHYYNLEYLGFRGAVAPITARKTNSSSTGCSYGLVLVDFQSKYIALKSKFPTLCRSSSWWNVRCSLVVAGPLCIWKGDAFFSRESGIHPLFKGAHLTWFIESWVSGETRYMVGTIRTLRCFEQNPNTRTHMCRTAISPILSQNRCWTTLRTHNKDCFLVVLSWRTLDKAALV